MRNRIAWMMATLLVLEASRAGDWPQWRGPMFNGSADETGLPDKLDPESNMVWKTELPGLSSGTPAVWGNRVFVTSLDTKSLKLLALCFDLKTGKELWRKEAGEGFVQKDRNNLATPSPITDGKHVWFYYGSGDLAAFDVEGKPVWSRNLVNEYGAFHINWLYTSSPLLYEGILFVQVIHRDVPPDGSPPKGPPADSYLLGIDPLTGKNIYRVIRPTTAREVAKEAYNTPMPYQGSGRKEVLLYGGDAVTGHDPQTGRELWRFTGYNTRRLGTWRVIPSVVTLGDIAVICTPQNSKRIVAFKLGGDGDTSTTHKAWENTDANSDAPTPLAYQGSFYVLDGDIRKGLYCIDPATGKTKWTTPLESPALLRSAPTGADGKIYLMNETAEVWVLNAADGKILSKTQLQTEGTARASIVAAQGGLVVRTGNTLYRFGRQQ